MKVLLIFPPAVNTNAVYPSITYLTGFLDSRGVPVVQRDFANELTRKMFSREGLTRIRDEFEREFSSNRKNRKIPEDVKHFLTYADRYIEITPMLLEFLQGKHETLAHRIVAQGFLPSPPTGTARISAMETSLSLEFFRGALDSARELIERDPFFPAFGQIGTQDRAKYLASRVLRDIAEVVRAGLDPEFEIAAYGGGLLRADSSFRSLRKRLEQPPTFVGRILEELTTQALAEHKPDLVGLSIPFPGTVLGAFEIARAVRKISPGTSIALGGGFANANLREVTDPAVFDYIDYLTLDDGEMPLLAIVESLEKKRGPNELLRTRVRREGKVELVSHPKLHDIPHRDTGNPTLRGLDPANYPVVVTWMSTFSSIFNHWWNKVNLAHGCYWKRCKFCDIHLDYVSRYQVAPADITVDRIEALLKESGRNGFHFVDEAAPPASIRALSHKLRERGTRIVWWSNIRLDSAFTPELSREMADSGCIFVTTGLEIPIDRLLKKMDKGITEAQTARVMRDLTQAGIKVHANLMFGYPTQTLQETIDSLEFVRQLYKLGWVHSTVLNRFTLTTPSAIGMNPKESGVRSVERRPRANVFQWYEIEHEEISTRAFNPDSVEWGLNHAIRHFNYGAGLDRDIRDWFRPKRVPATQLSPDYVLNLAQMPLAARRHFE